MPYLLALLAAIAFAFGSVFQQKGSLETAAGENDPRFLTQILKRPAWLLGGACQLLGWVFQAIALEKGSLIVVQSLITFSLVFALPLGKKITHQSLSLKIWLGAFAIVIGIIIFLSFGSPQTGSGSEASSTAWWFAGLSSLAIVLILGFIGSRRKGSIRALTFGAAAGVCFGLQASVTKVFMTLVGGGLAVILSSWTTYVLIATALFGFALLQSALKTGVLAPAMAASNAVTLFSSIILGVIIFGETLSDGNSRLLPALVGLALALGGIVLLASAKPPSVASGVHKS
jgi:drug/metabolite transporter (DMT)-like permease